MKTILVLIALFLMVNCAIAQPTPLPGPLPKPSDLNMNETPIVITIPLPEDPEAGLLPGVTVRVINGGRSHFTLYDFHMLTAIGKLQMVPPSGTLPAGWVFARTSQGGIACFAPHPAPGINPGQEFTFEFRSTDPSAHMSTLSRWYVTANGAGRNPNWTPRRMRRPSGTTPRVPQPTGTTPGTSPGGGTTPYPRSDSTPYSRGTVDYGPKKPGDPSTGGPTSTASAGCGDEEGVCTVNLGEPDPVITIGAEITNPAPYVVVMGDPLFIEQVLESDQYIPAQDNPYLEVEYIYDDGLSTSPEVCLSAPGSVFLHPTPLAEPAELALIIIVDDDNNGIYEPQWDLVSRVYPVTIR